MPIYQYQCPQCDTFFDKRQGFHDEAKAECPSCAYPEARRKLSLPAIVFKGSGFYVTDTRSSNAAVNAKSTSNNGKSEGGEGKAADDGKTAETTSESKNSSGESQNSDNKNKNGSSESKSNSESKATPETKAASKTSN